MKNSGLQIQRYEELPAACHEYDVRAPEVAVRVAAAIEQRLPAVRVEHIGSTAIPGCAGKGVIDLMALYPHGQLEAVKDLLDQLGFQRQSTRDPWPESRPMRLGAIEHDGTLFRLHVHVVAADSDEVPMVRAFRDRLRGDASLLAEYVARKRVILAAGVTDTVDYSLAKSDFISGALAP